MNNLIKLFVITFLFIGLSLETKSQQSCYEGFVSQAKIAEDKNDIKQAVISYQGIILRCPTSSNEERKFALEMIEKIFAKNSETLEMNARTLQKNNADLNEQALISKQISIQREIETIKTKALSNSFNSQNEDGIEEKLILSFYSKYWLDQINNETLHSDQAFSDAIMNKFSTINSNKSISEIESQEKAVDFNFGENIRSMDFLEKEDTRIHRLNNNQISLFNTQAKTEKRLTLDGYIYDITHGQNFEKYYAVTRKGTLYTFNVNGMIDSMSVSSLPLFDLKVNDLNGYYLINVGNKRLHLFDNESTIVRQFSPEDQIINYHFLSGNNTILIAYNKSIHSFDYSGNLNSKLSTDEPIVNFELDKVGLYKLVSFADNSVSLYNMKDEELASIANTKPIQSIYFTDDNTHFVIEFANTEIKQYPSPEYLYNQLLKSPPELSVALKEKYFIDDVVLSENLKQYLAQEN